MLSIGLKRVYYVCDKILVRNLRNRKPGLGANPGLQKRLDAFRDEGLKVHDNDAEEFVEQSDSDFYKVGEAYHDFLNETVAGKIELRHHIVKDKYFKENMPNLLTWSEKEQIRHLNMTQPDVWTPERIAESFPVTVQVAKKLLKYPWKPASEQRIARHDTSAMRNWRDLKEGHLDIPDNLRQHFLKFSERTIPPLNKKSIKIEVKQQEDLGEFERIIQRCATKDREASNETQNTEETSDKSETNAVKNNLKKEGRERITLDKLAEKVKQRLEQSNNLDIPDQIMINTINDDTELVNKNLTDEIELFDEESKNDVTTYKKNEDKVVHLKSYPERIRIPKKAYKRGATYRVDDCFYDDDGKFLYRVLGMPGKSPSEGEHRPN